MRQFILILSIITTVLLIFTSCSWKSPIQHTTNIWPTDKIMYEDSTYIFSDTILFMTTTIPANVTIRVNNKACIEIYEKLIVSEGVTFIMDSNTSIVTVTPNSVIEVNGTESSPVSFKSSDSLNNWEGISLSVWQGGPEDRDMDEFNIFEYAIIENATNGIICKDSQNIVLHNSIVRNCLYNGLTLSNGSAKSIQNSIFTNNGYSDIYSYGSNLNAIDSSNFFSSGIFLDSASEQNCTFPICTYTISEERLTLHGDIVINSGTVMRFKKGSSLRVWYGSLQVKGTLSNPVIFKNLK